MNINPPNIWDPRRDQEVRDTLKELKALEDAGYFEGLIDLAVVPDDDKIQELVTAKVSRAAPFLRRVSLYKPADQPSLPALSQFMSQISVRDRTEPYKQDIHWKFEEAVGQVRILFGKIVRGEIASNAVIRGIVGSFMDTFMKDRNIILNLALAPYTGVDYLYDHSLKSCLVSLSLASAAGYSRTQSIEVAQGALLSDVGMMLVPERIRLKRGKLSEADLFEVKKHPMLSLTLLEQVHGLSEASLIVPYQHHERLSGAGYPEKRAGNTVSKFSRIVAIADIFTALINRRTYRESILPYQAMVSILAMGGQGLLDGDQIKHFLKAVSIFSLGSLVRLTSGRIAKVVAPNPNEFTKPLVSVLTNENGTPLPRGTVHLIDLATSDEKIVEALSSQTIAHHFMDGF